MVSCAGFIVEDAFEVDFASEINLTMTCALQGPVPLSPRPWIHPGLAVVTTLKFAFSLDVVKNNFSLQLLPQLQNEVNGSLY